MTNQDDTICIGDLVKFNHTGDFGWVIAVEVPHSFRVEWSSGNKCWYNYNILKNLNRVIIIEKIS